MDLFDTHCHLDTEAFDRDREAVLAGARRAGVRRLLIPAIRRHGWRRLWDLCHDDPGLYPAIGLHPVMLHEHRARDIEALEDFVQTRRPAAIGEIGLDHAIRTLDPARQLALLEAQLAVAERHRLPVILHVRKAHEPILRALRRFRLPGGICHAFNGSLQQAERYRALGFRLGFGGMLTHPRSHHLHALAAQLPLDDLVLETDAPDMTGFCHRQQRNSPEYLPEVLATLAELRPETDAEIAARTTANALEVLGKAPSRP